MQDNTSEKSTEKLLSAALHGDINEIQELFVNGLDINAAGISNRTYNSISGFDKNYATELTGKTALHCAAKGGHYEIIEWLITKGADIHAQDGEGNTPIHYAVANLEDRHAIIELLLAKGANLEAKNNYGSTPLHYAILNSNNVKFLLSKGANVNVFNTRLESPLAWVEAPEYLLASKTDIIEILSSHGGINRKNLVAHIEEVFNESNSEEDNSEEVTDKIPKSYAILRNYLIKYPNLFDMNGVFDLAVGNKSNPLLQRVICNYNNKSIKESLELINFILDNGGDLHGISKSSLTPLSTACETGCIDIVKLLIDRGADVQGEIRHLLFDDESEYSVDSYYPSKRPATYTENKLDSSGTGRGRGGRGLGRGGRWRRRFNSYESATKPLHVAARFNHPEIINLLLERGANIEATDIDGSVALHQAVLADSLEIINILLKKGANIEAMDEDGLTALHYAVKKNSTSEVTEKSEIIRLLLKNNANVNVKSHAGETPLHLLIENSDEDGQELVELLLEQGAYIDEGVLRVAAKRSERDKLFNFLLDKYTKQRIHAQTKEGELLTSQTTTEAALSQKIKIFYQQITIDIQVITTTVDQLAEIKRQQQQLNQMFTENLELLKEKQYTALQSKLETLVQQSHTILDTSDSLKDLLTQQRTRISQALEKLYQASVLASYMPDIDKVTKVQAVVRGFFSRKDNHLNVMRETYKSEILARAPEIMSRLTKEGKLNEVIKLATAISNNQLHEAMQIIRGIPEQEMQTKSGLKVRY